jgi:hypothetical protein
MARVPLPTSTGACIGGASLLKARPATAYIEPFADTHAILTLPLGGAHMSPEEPVAQPVEHLTFNQGVSGSNPDGLTTYQRKFSRLWPSGESSSGGFNFVSAQCP